NDYLKYRREVNEAKEIEKRLMEELENISTKQNRLENQMLDVHEQKEALVERKRNLQAELTSIENDEEYKEVQSFTPIFTRESRKILREKIQTLNLKIHQVTISYGELNEKRTNAKNNIAQLTDEMNQIRHEYEKVDEHWEFPSDGDYLLQQKIEKINELK